MIAPYNQSGWVLERPDQPHGDLEMTVTCPSPYRGLAHLWHDRNLPFSTPELWNEGDRIYSSAFRGPFYGAACILSRYGNLEVVVAQTDGSLAHFWRNGIYGWRGPAFLPGYATGPPAFIQSRFGAFGNFEVIVPRPGGGLSHFWRENDGPATWHEAPPPTTTGNWSGLSLTHSSFGNLDLVGIRDHRLLFMGQDCAGGPWYGPGPIDVRHGSHLRGRPGFVESRSFPSPSFEIVAAHARAGLVHYSRNSTTKFLWQHMSHFGNDRNGGELRFDDVTIIQSSSGCLEVFAIEADNSDSGAAQVRHYRKASDSHWEGPMNLPEINPQR